MPLHIRRGGSTSYVPLSSSDPDLDDNTPPQHDMDPTTMKSGASDEEDRKSVEGDDTHAVTATQMGWLDRLRSTCAQLSFHPHTCANLALADTTEHCHSICWHILSQRSMSLCQRCGLHKSTLRSCRHWTPILVSRMSSQKVPLMSFRRLWVHCRSSQ